MSKAVTVIDTRCVRGHFTSHDVCKCGAPRRGQYVTYETIEVTVAGYLLPRIEFTVSFPGLNLP